MRERLISFFNSIQSKDLCLVSLVSHSFIDKKINFVNGFELYLIYPFKVHFILSKLIELKNNIKLNKLGFEN